MGGGNSSAGNGPYLISRKETSTSCGCRFLAGQQRSIICHVLEIFRGILGKVSLENTLLYFCAAGAIMSSAEEESVGKDQRSKIDLKDEQFREAKD